MFDVRFISPPGQKQVDAYWAEYQLQSIEGAAPIGRKEVLPIKTDRTSSISKKTMLDSA